MEIFVIVNNYSHFKNSRRWNAAMLIRCFFPPVKVIYLDRQSAYDIGKRTMI